MSKLTQEKAVNKGFSKIYEHYENLSQTSLIDKTMRQQLYRHIERFIKPKSSILELNSGSGIDAVYFAKKGHFVTATDIADGAETYIKAKIKKLQLKNLNYKSSSFTDLKAFEKNNFNYVFSNFGGLNCTDQLDKVAGSLSAILKESNLVTFVIMGKYYPWDWIYMLKGKFKRAFIRFKKNGASANVEGETIKTYYRTPKDIKQIMKPYFDFVASENLGVLYPSVNHTAITKHTKLIKRLIDLDSKISRLKLVPIGIGDYYIITFRKKNENYKEKR